MIRRAERLTVLVSCHFTNCARCYIESLELLLLNSEANTRRTASKEHKAPLKAKLYVKLEESFVEAYLKNRVRLTTEVRTYYTCILALTKTPSLQKMPQVRDQPYLRE